MPRHSSLASSDSSTLPGSYTLEADHLILSTLVDWRIEPDEIEICKHPDGSPWSLGTGGFGQVPSRLCDF